MKNDTLVIACRIFENELKHLLSPQINLNILWLDAALHADLDRMKEELSSAIAVSPDHKKGSIRFLFGKGCHPDICQLSDSCGGKLIPVKNCIQAIIGPEKTKQLEKDRTMVITPGWITAWSGIMDSLGWDEVDVRMHLGRYERILVLDSGVVPINDEEILKFYDLVQVPLEFEKVDLSYFRNVLSQLLPHFIEQD